VREVALENHHTAHAGDTHKNEERHRLPEGPEKQPVKVIVFATSNHASENRRFCCHPRKNNRRNIPDYSDGHSHLSRLNRTAVVEENWSKNLAGKINANPAYGDLPLKGPDLVTPAYDVLIGRVP